MPNSSSEPGSGCLPRSDDPVVKIDQVYCGVKDCTYYADSTDAVPSQLAAANEAKLRDQAVVIREEPCAPGARQAALLPRGASYSEGIVLTDGAGNRFSGRALACSCYRGQWTSITVRGEASPCSKGTALPRYEAVPGLSEFPRSTAEIAPRLEGRELTEIYEVLSSSKPNGWPGRPQPQDLPRLNWNLAGASGQMEGGPNFYKSLQPALDRALRRCLVLREPILPTLSEDLCIELNGLEQTVDGLAARNILDRLIFPPGEVTPQSRYCQAKGATAGFPVPLRLVYKLLARSIFKPDDFSRAHGLVVVSGATASGKSSIVRGLIYEYMAYFNTLQATIDRRPHLVTLEDPIEEWFVASRSPSDSQRMGVDYTPRQVGTDVPDIQTGLRDALRQTPAAVFVGETRDDRDWRELLHFAGTGHLVVTTTHAGSLVETIERILEAVPAESPAQRGQVAERILAVVHLQPFGIGDSTVVLPALWRQSSTGIAALVADGLASILPSNPPDGHFDRAPARSSIGRRWFAERLARYLPRGGEQGGEMCRRAQARDLQGV